MSQYASYSGYGGGGGGVTTLNGEAGAVNIVAGSGITVTPAGQNITIDATNAGAVTNVTASSPIASSGGATPNITIQNADTTHTGALTSTDWNTFNNKQSSLTLGNLTDVGTDGIVITGGTGSVVGSGTSIAQHVADSTHNGYLSSSDWSTFNNKQTSGNYITALTGDVTAAGPDSVAATIGNNAVTNAKSAQMATLTIKGNNTGGTANAIDLTVAQVNAILPVFTSTLNGSVPFSGGGTTNFLRADGTWAVAGTGSVTSVALSDSTGLFNITGSPITSSGTLTLSSFQSQTQNKFLASPNGSTGAPTFRAIVAADIPTLNQNTTGTAANITSSSNSTLTTLSALSLPGSQVTGNISGNAANVTGVVAIANGGTGSATQNFVDLTTDQTIAGNKSFSNALTLTQIATPANPASGKNKVYVKSDGNIYNLTSGGVETIVGPGMSGSDWKNDLTFAPSSSFTTVHDSNYWYRRVGDSMQVRANWATDLPSGSVAYFSLPNGYVIDSAKLSAQTNLQVVGSYYFNRSTGTSYGPSAFLGNLFFDGSDTSSVYFAYQGSSNAMVKANANDVSSGGNNNSTTIIEFTVPIVGWSVNNGSNAPTPSMRYYSSTTTISSTLATIVYATQDYDNNSTYSSGTYTIPQAGKYQINAALLVTGTIALNNSAVMEIQKNGTVVSRFTEFFPASLTDGKLMLSDIINCALNDTIRIQVSTTVTLPSIVSSNFDNYLSISKLN